MLHLIMILTNILNNDRVTFMQELLAYEESSRKYPKLFQRMQPKLLDVLLKEVYIGEENVLQRSKLIVKKGRALKTSGADGLKDSLECFSAAISSLVSFFLNCCFPCNPLHSPHTLIFLTGDSLQRHFQGKFQVILSVGPHIFSSCAFYSGSQWRGRGSSLH